MFLDNDILLHPGTFETLIEPLERDPKVFMSTGYPFDIPLEGAGLMSYAILVRWMTHYFWLDVKLASAHAFTTNAHLM